MNQSEVSVLPKRKCLIDTNVNYNSQKLTYYGDPVAKQMELKEKKMSLFTRMDPPLSVWVNFNPTGHDWRMTFYIVEHKMGF